MLPPPARRRAGQLQQAVTAAAAPHLAVSPTHTRPRLKKAMSASLSLSVRPHSHRSSRLLPFPCQVLLGTVRPPDSTVASHGGGGRAAGGRGRGRRGGAPAAGA